MDTTSRWMLVKEAAEYLQMNADRLRTLFRRGDIKAVRQPGGTTWRTKREWLDAYLLGEAA
ncbi:helix-turn-helix domain-containing protein [Ancrocorticia populi]|uniref:helix-turn-helix domain-containing protein n=1 Tax=Ancrocorticia populi TaxID=2175228 RepID=UPI003F954198